MIKAEHEDGELRVDLREVLVTAFVDEDEGITEGHGREWQPPVAPSDDGKLGAPPGVARHNCA